MPDSPDSWITCPDCPTQVKAANLADHQARVHGRGRTPATAETKRRNRKRLLMAVAAVLAVALVSMLILQGGERTSPDLRDTDDPAWGSPDAQLTVFYFADYQCPVCQRFETQGGLDHLLQTWVEPGQVRIVYKDLAFISADSVVAAEASQVVWAMEPEAWADWNRYVFEHQGPERSGWADRDGMVALAEAWGRVEMTEFTARLDSHEFRAEVEADIEEARAAGVSSTPTIVVGAQRINGNDLAAVDEAISEALE